MTRRTLRLIALTAAAAAAPALRGQQPASMQPAQPAAQKPTPQQVQAAIDTMRAEVASARKQTVAQNMTFTDAEATKFWPVYDAYRADMKKAKDGEWAVIQTYAQNMGKITDSLAQSLMNQWMASRKAQMDLRASYVPKFVQAIGWMKAARYFQIEEKLDAILDFNRAKQIPLVQ